jgi:hypothetical protein
MMLSHRVTNRNGKNGESALMSAPQVAKLFEVPECRVREQVRLGALPSIRLGHYVRFKAEEIQRAKRGHPSGLRDGLMPISA